MAYQYVCIILEKNQLVQFESSTNYRRSLYCIANRLEGIFKTLSFLVSNFI